MKYIIVEGKGCHSSKYNIDTTSGCSTCLTKQPCTYCYGSYLNQRDFKIKTCDTKSLDRQWKKFNTDHRIIRIGKFTDPGYESTELLKLLNWMKINKIRPVIVTKQPHGNEDIYKLVTELNGVYQITLGYDDLEKGICANSFTNDYRIMIGEEYLNRGYNVKWRLVREATGQADTFTKEFIIKHKSNILLTPLRLKSKVLIQQLGGDINKYMFESNFYRPQEIHKDYDNLATCLSTTQKDYCSKCLLN